ncbi:hypothetical protein EDB89DRAFT_1835929, partial [Lactarius sanguifluus]
IWLKSYLNISPSRPAWAIVTDILICVAAPPGMSAVARTNSFFQKWEPAMRGPRAEKLGDDIRRMLRVVKKYNTNLTAIRLSATIKSMLATWYHPGVPPRPLTNVMLKCLLNKHKITTIAELIKSVNKILERNGNQDHIPSQVCICRDCVQDRLEGCRNPQACAEEALSRLSEIAPKYNPLERNTLDNLSLTHRRITKNKDARDKDGNILFNPTITCKNSLVECFRTFTDPEKLSLMPASCQQPRGINLSNQTLEVYTDGACMNNSKANARCGGGVWVNHSHLSNSTIRVPGPHQSNQVGEIAAVIVAVEKLPNFCPLIIKTD